MNPMCFPSERLFDHLGGEIRRKRIDRREVFFRLA